MIQIKDKDGKLLKEIDRADLRGANLGDANLRGADLWGANLGDTNLRGADLRDANLGDANLRCADLRDANLGDANLWGATLDWYSHQLISEILLRSADDDIDRISLAGIVRIKTEWWKATHEVTPRDGPELRVMLVPSGAAYTRSEWAVRRHTRHYTELRFYGQWFLRSKHFRGRVRVV